MISLPMEKEADVQPQYTSPPKEQLEIRPTREEYKFIASVRTGKRDLMTLGNGKRRFRNLMKAGFIQRGFVLPNPLLFEESNVRKNGHSPRIFFLFLKVEAKHYFGVKEWIINKRDNSNLSAYTTLGLYDFVIRLVSTEAEIDEICGELKSRFSLNNNALHHSSHLLRIDVTHSLYYDRVFAPSSAPKIALLDSKKRECLFSMNEELSIERVERADRKLYRELQEQGYVLGTRCLVNTSRLHNMVSFILVQYRDVDQLQEVLNNARLKESIIDSFTITAPQASLQYSALLVCEFSGAYNALCAYNRWMDDFYWLHRELSCLTFESDSTICEAPDIYESCIDLKRKIEKQWSHDKGVYIGNGVWFGNEKADLKVYVDYESLIFGGCIIGGTRSGKTNTCLHLAVELRKKGVDILIASFKPGTFTQDLIESMGGTFLSPEAFLKIDASKPFEPGFMYVEADIYDTGRQIAKHCLSVISNHRSEGTQKPLNLVVFLDEVLNLNKDVGEVVDQVIHVLNVCAESGVGLLVTAQSLDKWDRLWAACKNKFIHSIDSIDGRNTVISELLSIPGFESDVSVGMTKMQQGQIVCSVVTKKKDRIPAIVVKVPRVK
jgi:DNA-binding Lrp family transcriptional regulator